MLKPQMLLVTYALGRERVAAQCQLSLKGAAQREGLLVFGRFPNGTCCRSEQCSSGQKTSTKKERVLSDFGLSNGD